ncbi:zinc-dependent alcohol dehydrogenase family protein [Carnimonas nigrificans]|uniref:zinc-dependent alcohol dehydrogenase family protein n=1 Tax=Carnimonas nigrificans TaxID=64323 RepID=UPI0004B85148|nr:zinc-dependent alcohol dehydrogenase family protein [Carnimonas nigrificans]
MPPITTRAAVLRKTGTERPYSEHQPLAIEEFTLTPPDQGELLIKIRAAGLCHSDLSVINGDRPRDLPMVLGHEAAGEVVEVGPNVTRFAAGDHVVLSFVPSCGSCAACLDGHAALCAPGARANGEGVLLNGGRHLFQGDTAINHHLGVSGFAEYAVVSERSAVKIDKEMPFDVAAVFGCAVLTGAGALLQTAKLRAGQSVLIVGLGGVGLSAVLAAIAAGARRVIVADIQQSKIDQALALGADIGVLSSQADAIEHVLTESEGGVDIAADYAGVAAALEFAYACTRQGGTTVSAGLPHPDARIQLSPSQLVAQERKLLGSYLGGHVPALDTLEYMALYRSGRLPVDQLITHRITLDQINEGFERLAAGEAIRQIILFD